MRLSALSTFQAASTSYALAANENCVWLATVEPTPRAPNGSSTKAAMPMPVKVSACARCEPATPRLPGVTMTSGNAAPSDLPGGRNSLPSMVTRAMSAAPLMAWW